MKKDTKWNYPAGIHGRLGSFGMGCNFMYEGHRIRYVDTSGLNSYNNPGCHVSLDLYYESGRAKTKVFKTYLDAYKWAKEQENKITNG